MNSQAYVLPRISEYFSTMKLMQLYKAIDNGSSDSIMGNIGQDHGGTDGIPKWRTVEVTPLNMSSLEDVPWVKLIWISGMSVDQYTPIKEENSISKDFKNMISYMAMNLQSKPHHIEVDGSRLDLSVHQGYYTAAEAIASEVNDGSLDQFDEVIFFGHSLGGAVAQIAAIYLQETLKIENVKGFGFGVPRCVSEDLSKLSAEYCLTLINPDDPFVNYKSVAELMSKANGLRILERCNLRLFEEKSRAVISSPLSDYYFPEMVVAAQNHRVQNDGTTSIATTLQNIDQIEDRDITLGDLKRIKANNSVETYISMVSRAENGSIDEFKGDITLSMEEYIPKPNNFKEAFESKNERLTIERLRENQRILLAQNRKKSLSRSNGVILTKVTPEENERVRQEMRQRVEAESIRALEMHRLYEERERIEEERRLDEERFREEQRKFMEEQRALDEDTRIAQRLEEQRLELEEDTRRQLNELREANEEAERRMMEQAREEQELLLAERRREEEARMREEAMRHEREMNAERERQQELIRQARLKDEQIRQLNNLNRINEEIIKKNEKRKRILICIGLGIVAVIAIPAGIALAGSILSSSFIATEVLAGTLALKDVVLSAVSAVGAGACISVASGVECVKTAIDTSKL